MIYDMSKRKCNQKHVNVRIFWRLNEFENTYLKLRSGDAQRIAMLGIGGTRRIAIITWFFQRRDRESRWLSEFVFFGGAELRNKDARLSLTGLNNGDELHVSKLFFEEEKSGKIPAQLRTWHFYA